MRNGVALRVLASLCLCLPAGAQAFRHPSAIRLTPESKSNRRQDVVGRWVSERGVDAFLVLSPDGTYQAGDYQGRHPCVSETGTYTVTADGSVTVVMARHGGGGTYQRRGDALYAAIGPYPWVRWHKEHEPHRPLMLTPEPHPIP